MPTGESTLGVSISRTGRTIGAIALTVDGVEAGSAELPFMMRMISSLGASLGYDHGSPVSPHDGDAFPFAGTLHEVEISLGGRSQQDTETTARTEMSRQ